MLNPGDSRSIVVRSLTGYARRYPADRIDKLWIVSTIGGEPLSAGHGFPARIVSTNQRGFWWVKWVASIETSSLPWWIQPPYPLT
jgi:DMSO/TMAO reductase YedYZ molybdopterin-dependent catalytic subunit